MTRYGWDFIAAGMILIGLTMFANFTSVLKRVRVSLSALAAAAIGALPVLLDQLGVIDLKPLLQHLGLSPEWSAIVVGMMPFVLAFLRPLVHLVEEEPK